MKVKITGGTNGVKNESNINSQKEDSKDKVSKYRRSLLIKFVTFILSMFLIFNYVIGMVRVTGKDMFPSLTDGDLMVYNRLERSYQKDDIVVFSKGGDSNYLRIVGTQNDTVDISEDGELIINGNIQEEEIYFPTFKFEEVSYPYTVKEGEVFVLGDFRTESNDSRTFGAISTDSFKGKAITILRNRGL